jgi:hypothetical protein
MINYDKSLKFKYKVDCIEQFPKNLIHFKIPLIDNFLCNFEI